jgi:predicted phage-related endonuclease
MIERHQITTRDSWLEWRTRDVTASAAAALFGVHPYTTPFQLYALKSGLTDESSEETPAMRRGRLLEPVAIDMLREERPTWKIEGGREYLRDPDARIGATPDALATRPDIEGLGIVQIKTAGHFAFKQGWKGSDGEIEVPLWIGVQASVEAALSGATWAAVAVLALGDGGLDMHIADVPLKPALMTKLHGLVSDFWRRVDESDPYPADYARDAAAISAIYREDDGGEVDLSGNERVTALVTRREELKAIEAAASVAQKERKPIDAELVHALGNATRGLLGGGRILEAKTVRRGAYEVKATSYRNLKVIGGQK